MTSLSDTANLTANLLSSGDHVVLGQDAPLRLECGVECQFTIAYQSYGTSTQITNAVLICHALSMDQYAAGINLVTGKSGWWSVAIDLASYSILTVFHHLLEYSGRLHGHNGAKEINPETGKVWGSIFRSLPYEIWLTPKPGFSTIWKWKHCLPPLAGP